MWLDGWPIIQRASRCASVGNLEAIYCINIKWASGPTWLPEFATPRFLNGWVSVDFFDQECFDWHCVHIYVSYWQVARTDKNIGVVLFFSCESLPADFWWFMAESLQSREYVSSREMCVCKWWWLSSSMSDEEEPGDGIMIDGLMVAMMANILGGGKLSWSKVPLGVFVDYQTHFCRLIIEVFCLVPSDTKKILFSCTSYYFIVTSHFQESRSDWNKETFLEC